MIQPLTRCAHILNFAVLFLAAACTNLPGLHSSTSQDSLTAPFHEWQIIDTATGQPVPSDQWLTMLLQQDLIYLGEEHHNRFHIDAALTVLRRLTQEDRTPVLAMEMFGWDGQEALNHYLSGSHQNRQEFLEQVRWQQNWGGAFSDYEPLAQFAKEQGLPVVALNPPKSLIRLVAKQGLTRARSDPAMAEWNMADESIVDDPVYRTRILQQLQACHGGGEDRLYYMMYDASMVRDEGMARTLAQHLLALKHESNPHAGPLVSYTGGGHIQYNLPVPKRVTRRIPFDVRQISVYMTSFEAGRVDELHTMIRERIADYLWLTPVSDLGLPRRCR